MSFQIKKVVTASSSAAPAVWALDLESDDVPDQFKCPVCMDVPMEEIFQCPNGHTVCKTCRQDMCAQCRSPMMFPGKRAGTPEGLYMRNRALEHLLDSIHIACPFKNNGCLEIALGRANLKAHVEKCCHDGNRIQLCSHLGYKNCGYWAKSTKPLEVVEHFRSTHKSRLRNGTTWSLHLHNASTTLRTVPVEHATAMAMPWPPKLIKAFNGDFLVVNLFNRADCTLSFVGLRVDKQPEEVQMNTQIEVKVLTKNAEMPDLIWKMSTIPILKAATVLKYPPVCVPAAVLKNYYLDDGGSLKIRITVSH